GDLSFFYTVGALWNTHEIKNLRILLMNNGGGGIFHLLPGLTQANSLAQVAATHDTSAAKWAEAAGLSYLCANDMSSFDDALKAFMSPDAEQSVLLEVFTDMETNKKAFQDYYKGLSIK
ncbi:MAG: thiamine pyrophosphate-dependent enzyme, partial [Saezia sp.]